MTMKIKLSKDRKMLAIGTDEFSLTLNGKSNAAYKAILQPLGIELEFEDVDAMPLELTKEDVEIIKE